MADIAQIGFKADTSDLDAAKQKLEALTPAAAGAEKASDKLEKTLEALAKATGDLVKASDTLTKASDKLMNSHKNVAANANDAKSASDKLNSSHDKSAEAATKAAAASKKLEDQVNRTAKATEAAGNVALRSLKDEAAARLAAERAAGKQYSSGLTGRENMPAGARKANGGIIPNFEQNSAQIQAGLDKLAGSQKKAEAANDNFEKGLEKTGATAKSTGGILSALGGAILRFGAAMIAAFAVNKLVDFAKKSVAELVALGDTAKRTGIDLQRLQELQYAGVQKGLSRDQFNSGVEGLAEKLNEARHTENELSKLFDDNNIKLKTRTGEVMSTNDALMRASGLIQNAATEFDKIKIAEALGLTREWIPLLEQGPDAINKMADAAGGLGTIFDREAIEKARKFNEEWSTAVDRWVQMFKQAAIAVLGFLDWIISKASGLFGMLDTYSKKIQAGEDFKANGIEGASRDTVDFLLAEAKRQNTQVEDVVIDRKNALDKLDRENARFRQFEDNPSNPLTMTLRKPATGKATDVSSLFNKGGGGGGGNTDEENFDTIIRRAEARISKLQAERDAIGLTAEAAARLKYETDLLNQAKRADIDLTDEQREKLMGLASQMAVTETETKNLKSALDFGKDVTKGFLTDFLNGVKNGEGVFKSFGNAALGVLNKISDKLISMAVDSLFSKGGSGGLGGFLGSLGKLIFGGGSALGDAFTGAGKVQAFAKGGSFTNGIYSNPTLFQYANGGAFGVMGEAGPEAIMPLKRGPDGSLGVEMHSGSGAGQNGPISNNVDITNVFRIEGAVSSKDVIEMTKSAAEQTKNEVRRNMVGWLNQYNIDGAIV